MAERASKYLPLQLYLSRQTENELRMTFHDVERALGFELPPSARHHPAWWSNNPGTNVAVKAWRDAGWRSTKVDLRGERVTFVRDNSEQAHGAGERRREPNPGLQDIGAAYVSDDPITISRFALRGAAMRMLEDYREAEGGDLAGAIAGLLNAMALERRRRLVDWFRENAPKVTGDSTDLIREDRDAR